MLPDYNTCRKHIQAYIHHHSVPAGKVGFRNFWNYKVHLENEGHSILDKDKLQETASKLRDFLIFWGMGITGVAESHQIENLLRRVRPYYGGIRDIKLGDGKILQHRDHIEAIYSGLDGITNRVDYPNGSKSSITGKSKTLLAIWGQTPGFDSLTRKRFLKWTHLPEPRYLNHLCRGERWYEPSEFYDMITQLDDWVSKWPESNNGRIFADSFSDLCPGLPVGRIIDMIYNWKFPDPRVD